MVYGHEDLAKIIKAHLISLGVYPSDEETLKLSRDINNVLKISSMFDEILSHEEEPAIFFLLRVEDDEKT
ncbi:MAG: hypothetical protein RMJ14_05335 [Nitrososphaerota archaeon]|nr:hypothetical protein [Aigarchaeota archaeon]MDW8077041.1 hypothetical protein [Nitrososphaerota archaeon]